MSAVQVREAAAADPAVLAVLLAQLGYPAEAGALPRRLAALAAEGMGAFVADVGGAVVGLVTVAVLPVIHHDTPVAMLTALVVSESARSRGIGRALVARAESFGRARGCERIIVTTAEPRSDAHAFYTRLGWEYTGRRFAKPLS